MFKLKDIPLNNVVEILHHSMADQLTAEIEAALLERVKPRVREIAATTAQQLVEHLNVTAFREHHSPAPKLVFTFNGEIYKDPINV